MKRKLQLLPPSFRRLLNAGPDALSIENGEPSAVVTDERSRDRTSEENQEEESFSDSFFNSGTDFSYLYEVDEYGIPCEIPVGPDTESNLGSFPSVKETEINLNGIRNESFKESFYRSGVDWTSLCHVDECKDSDAKGKANGKLVQASLSSLWGLQSKSVTEDGSSSVTFEMESVQSGILSNISRNGSVPAEKMSRQGLPLGGREKLVEGTRQRFKTCPFYKKIPGTSFTVDAFQYGSVVGCTAYFLTHFHSDHYGGLSKRWSDGPIYCTPTTARLLALCISVDTKFICPLDVGTVHVIDGTEVLMLDANHCPGAALIHFRLKDGQCFLHTGDFRACKEMQSYPIFRDSHINSLYLDTTYCNPKYRFPPQKDVIDYVVKVTINTLSRDPKTLVVVGAYSLGKERVYHSIAEALGVQIYVDNSRRRILGSLNWPALSEKLCSDARCTLLHVLPISSLHPKKLEQYLQTVNVQFTSVLAFRPTGWTFSDKIGNQLEFLKPLCKGNVTIYGVPYSEHSSFLELKEFVQFLRPKRIIPTVNNGSPAQRDRMQAYFRQWLSR